MKFTKDFVVASLQEAADIAASTISQQFALNQIATKGSCTLEEAENMYNLAHRVLIEGTDDLIPETLDLPEGGDEATDQVDPTLAQDQAVDAEVGAGTDEGADLDLEDLDGIILPDSEGNQYIIQGGILTPYNEEDTGADEDEGGDAGIPVDGDDAGAPVGGDDNLEEGTVVTTTPEAGAIEEGTISAGEATANVEAGDVKVDTIQENTVFAGNSSIVANLLKNMNV